MRKGGTLWTSGDGRWRIQEHADEWYEYENLVGDRFNPTVNSGIDPEQLATEEDAFKNKVAHDGVFGYNLERWNPEPGCGWECVDSCWGFVGNHDTENHYIVAEMQSWASK